MGIINNDHRTMRQFMEALVVLEVKEGWADICNARYEKNPDDPETERAFERAYQDELAAFSYARDLLVKLGVDSPIAGTLIRAKRDEVKDIVRRWRTNRGSPAAYWKDYIGHYQ